jgi:hypothetical protein
MKKLFTLLISTFITYNHVEAQTTVNIQPDAATGYFSLIVDDAPNASQPTVSELNALAWTHGSPFVQRSLFKFNLASIPTNAIVQSATLFLYYNPNTTNVGTHSQTSGSNSAIIQRITSNWDKNTVCWNNQPSYSTANQVILPASTSSTQNYAINVTSMMQDMISNPASSFGFMLKLQNEQYYRCLVFASCNHTNSALRPKLNIVYTVNPAAVNQFENSTIDFSVSPNPTTNFISLKSAYFHSNETVSIAVVNAIGQTVLYKNEIWSNCESLSLETLSSGTYFLQVKSDRGFACQKIIIN